MPPPDSASKPRTRNGKIARLPYLERDMVNRMLRDNIPLSKIVRALADSAVTVTERNVSNWKTRGGFREWCQEQDRALETRLLQDNLTESLRKNEASQLPEVGLQLAATHLSHFLLQPEARRQLDSEPEKYARVATVLCRIARQIHEFQKYRDDSVKNFDPSLDPERVKRKKSENVEWTRDYYSAAKVGESVHEPIIPHRNYLPKA